MLKLAVAFAVVCATRVAGADALAASILQFGVPAAMSSTLSVDVPHFLYVPAIGAWLDIARPGLAQSAMVFDGVCQDLVVLAFALRILAVPATLPPWRFMPWFPQSGGGGVSLLAMF